ncbi:MAG: type II/IV secretion system protein [Selenomonadaceae bacterium]|nr:type II/IV secretion system protein [Selenomonadaceae bacterium]MBQ6132021.1 type II/IV secretion system protein [Selenomonadaceae bacterium]MBQ7493886.1 type II/IV secretion system protein [Selenomonadaceae bacterium]
MNDFDEQLRKLIHRERHNFAGSSSRAIVELVNLLFDFAIKIRASDLHIEPYEKSLRVRYRIDGQLQELHQPLPLHLADALTSRIKILAHMDTTAAFLPLDGAIQFGNVEMRVASMPSFGAESLTIRLLDTTLELHNLKDLGFTAANEKIFRQIINSATGMIILTGPMNSGKSTTLYAALRELNQPTRSIMTLEDPIEQHVEGISQVQVNEKTDLTFAAGLRAMLRMDCNVLMVGEARDAETSKIAIRAALTGHLIFTTLHANDSCSAVFRMLEMGVEPYLLAATLNGVVAQRLVRRICPHCQAKGCEHCRGTGYSGRIALHEILRVDKNLRNMILNSRDLDAIKTSALDAGLKTLVDDALEKVRAGLTTLEEVRRVLGMDFFKGAD